MKRVMVAMSGGVDSSVAACLLQEQGYDVVGFTMSLAKQPAADDDWAIGFDNAVDSARQVCAQLGIRHIVVNMRAQFEALVLADFFDNYRQGLTPCPCALCNETIKFGLFAEQLGALGADFLATGHYARLVRDEQQQVHLYRGLDRHKDQSYFLGGLRAEQLERALFPLGDYRKAEVRELAASYGLANAKRSDSQDLCFIPDGQTQAFLRRHLAAEQRPGPVIDGQGQCLGQHCGLAYYTIGQRKGLPVNRNRPTYVKAIKAAANTLVVDDYSALFSRQMRIRRLGWLVEPGVEPLTLQYRSTSKEAEVASLSGDGDNTLVTFAEPQRALAPGQRAVFYRQNEVLGGGIIAAVG